MEAVGWLRPTNLLYAGKKKKSKVKGDIQKKHYGRAVEGDCA